ncbi:MinD/ParA family protein [Bdellovibrio sp. HCB337]|uniref:MinD/ParA family protein n=1 Tax=Bdellovibrio sp. HCB337 TaxID=3394358 RepID=UPI0039A4E031
MKYNGLFQNSGTRTISITSGKGGVGKTTLTSNIALRLSQTGNKVLIFDGDLGMANVDILYGVKSDGNIHDVIMGEKSIHEVIVEVAKDVFLIPGGSGVLEFNNLNSFQRRAMIEAVGTLPQDFDYMLIDTAPGIADNVLYLNAAAQTISVVITPDPASLADSYALIKVLHQKYKENKFAIICNNVRDEAEGVGLYQRFNDVVNKFLYIGLDYWGSVPMDPVLRKATQLNRLIMRHDMTAESAKAIKNLSLQIENSSQKIVTKGGLQMFWEQVVGVA